MMKVAILVAALCFVSVRSTVIGGDCTGNSQCSDDNDGARCMFVYKGCDTGTCQCPSDDFRRAADGCVSRPSLGQSCRENGDCSWRTTNSFCNADNECACTAGTDPTTIDGHVYCAETNFGQSCEPGGATVRDSTECLSFRHSNVMGACIENDAADDVCGCAVGYRRDGNTQKCRTYNRNEACDIAGEAQGGVCTIGTGLTCRDVDGTDQCACPAGSSWKADGYNICTRDENTINRSEGQTCDEEAPWNNDAAILCNPDLECASCAGNNQDQECKKPSGAASVTIAMMTLITASMTTFL